MEKKSTKGLNKAVEILGKSREGDNTKLVHLFKWMNTGKKINDNNYLH